MRTLETLRLGGRRFADVVSSGEIKSKELALAKMERRDCDLVVGKKVSPSKERLVDGGKREVLSGNVMDESIKEGRKSRGFFFKNMRSRSGKYDVRAVEEAAFGSGGIIDSRRLEDKSMGYEGHRRGYLEGLFGMGFRAQAASNVDNPLGGSSETVNNSVFSLKEGPSERVLCEASVADDSEEERSAANDHEEPKKSNGRFARFFLGDIKKNINVGKPLVSKVGSGGSEDSIEEESASEDEIKAVERYSSTSEEELLIGEKGRAASRSDFYVSNREIEGSFLDFEGSVKGSSNTIPGHGSECEKGSSKGKPRPFVALKGLVKKMNRAKTRSVSDDDSSDSEVKKKSSFRALKRLLKKRNKAPESVITTEEKEEHKKSFFHLIESGLGVAAVCACISAMAIVFKVCSNKTNNVGIHAYIACVLATIIGIAMAVAVLHYFVPKVVDKTKTQSSAGKKGRDIFEKDCLFWMVEFKNVVALRYGYTQAKKMAAKSAPTKHLGFNNNGKLFYKGFSVPEKVCPTATVFGSKCSEMTESGGHMISRIHFQDPDSMAFLRKIHPAVGEDLRDYLTFRPPKADIKDAYRFSACFKYRFADRETYIRFALAMAQAGCNELLMAYLSSFMPKVSYARGEGCEGLSLRFMKTKEWKLLCSDEARFGLLSKTSTYCKKGIIEDQKKFLKYFLDAYGKHAPANSKQAWGEKNSVDGAACMKGEKGPGFPFNNPRYALALDRLAKGCGARVEEDAYTGYRAFIKDENMRFGFANAVFVKEGTVDCVYDYIDTYCTRETTDTYISNMRKEQVHKGWCRFR